MIVITGVKSMEVPSNHGVYVVRYLPGDIRCFDDPDEFSEYEDEIIKGRRFIDPKMCVDTYIGCTKEASGIIGPIFESYDRIQKENNELRETNREILTTKGGAEVKVDKRWYSEETMAAVVKERDELKEINREMLEELTRTTRWLDANFEPTSQFLRNIHVIEKATGKTWAEIKEAGE